MRVLKSIILLNLLFSLFLLSSCRTELDIDVTETIEDLPVELINTHIFGQVIDENNRALTGVNVRIQNEEILTDENGYFAFDDIKADKNGTHIIASKKGYFKNTVTVYPNLNNTLYSSIILNEKIESASLLSYNGAKVEIGQNMSIHIDPNTLVLAEDGSDFSGMAYIEFAYEEIGKDVFDALLIGEQIGINVSDQRVGLNPISFLKIELSDGKNNPLRLAKGATAGLQINIENALNSNIETIPVWSFDPTSSRWLQNGEVISDGENEFVGEVSSLNYLAIAEEFPVVLIEGSLNYETNNDASGHRIRIKDIAGSASTYFKTDLKGNFKGYVPQNRDLNMEVINECAISVFNGSIGTFSNTTNIEEVMALVQGCRVVPIKGQLLDCFGDPVSYGYVQVSSTENTSYFRTDANGYYSGEFQVCEEETFTLNAGNFKTNVVSRMHEGLHLRDSILVGEWKICEGQKHFIDLEFNKQYYFLNDNVYSGVENGIEIGQYMLFGGENSNLSVEGGINVFEGEGFYYIKSEMEIDFIFNTFPKDGNSPALFPKDESVFNTYILEIKDFVDGVYAAGVIEGYARDANHDNQEGMMYIKFNVPDN